MDKVPDYIIEKAVDIWCKALHNPKFDNGDNSPHGSFAMGLASMNCESARTGVDMGKEVEKFRINLTRILKKDREENGGYGYYLQVDYGPCRTLRDACEGTKIDKSMFSYKSAVSVHNNSISSSFGYGEPHTHYYMFKGKWVLTKSVIHESEREEILSAIIDGRLSGFTIEGEIKKGLER